MDTPTAPPAGGRLRAWLLAALIAVAILLVAVLFVKKITQLALPGLGVPARTLVIEPQCPTPEQRTLIEDNLKLYGAGFSQGYDNTVHANRLLALARTLGYPDPRLNDIQSVVRFLREALKKRC